MLTIGRPELLIGDDRTVLRASADADDGTKRYFWFSTTPDYGQYLCAERADAFLVATLLYAMHQHHDIRILVPICERLFYTISEYLIPALHRAFPTLKHVSIECDLDTTTLPNAGAVGTGASCGVDSFFTVARHSGDQCPPGFRITHLTFHDAGSHGIPGARSAQLARERLIASREFACQLGLPLVVVETNLSDITNVINMSYQGLHTYMNVACVLSLQKLFKSYFYSSTYSLEAFAPSLYDSAYYDSYSLPLLSTDQLDVFSAGTPYSRVEKTRFIADYELSYRLLNVCITAGRNCSSCDKCLRTLLTLDALGVLERYRDVFDLATYARLRSRYVVEVMHRNDEFSRDICALMKEMGFSIPRADYLRCSLRRRLGRSPTARKLYSAFGGLRGTR